MPKRTRCEADKPQAPCQTVHQFQDLPEDCFPLRTVHLQLKPGPEEVTLWRQSGTNRRLNNVRLIGDAELPEEWVPVSAKDLVCNCRWAACMLELDNLNDNGEGVDGVARSHSP